MKMLAVIFAALGLVGVTGAHAQIVYRSAPYAYAGAPYAYAGAPYAYAGVPYAAPFVVVEPAPTPAVVIAPVPYGEAYIPGPYPGSAVVDPYTGRWCTFEPSGWHWCWTP
jgi:hypothetical protein